MKIKIVGGIYMSLPTYCVPNQLCFFKGKFDAEKSGLYLSDYIPICAHTIEIDGPEADTVSLTLKAFNNQLKAVDAAHTVAVMRIKKSIADLLCIENKPREA